MVEFGTKAQGVLEVEFDEAESAGMQSWKGYRGL